VQRANRWPKMTIREYMPRLLHPHLMCIPLQPFLPLICPCLPIALPCACPPCLLLCLAMILLCLLLHPMLCVHGSVCGPARRITIARC
jgi:hypothetical protein